jgi:putative membrane protein
MERKRHEKSFPLTYQKPKDVIMWGCDYIPFLGGSSWAGGFFPGGIFYLLVWGLMVFLFVYATVRIFKAVTTDKSTRHRDRIDSLAILKFRFAKGEISSEEFSKMKQILSQS